MTHSPDHDHSAHDHASMNTESQDRASVTHTTDGAHSHPGGDTHEGHDKHAGHSVKMFRDKFWGSIALTVPTVIWSPMVQQWLGYQAPSFPGSRYVLECTTPSPRIDLSLPDARYFHR